MALVAIDPGKATGFALFEDGLLVRAAVCNEDECLRSIENAAAGDCVIEVPQVYPGQRQKGDQNDLIGLAVTVGRYADRARACGFRVVLVKPREWKGQLPKDVCWTRARETLTQRELGSILNVPKSKAHNMHDAIGLGTWFQKRWK